MKLKQIPKTFFCQRETTTAGRWMASNVCRTATLLAVVAFVLSSVAPAQASTIYVTADNGTTNLFGTLNIATGQFNQIATTTPLFFALTTGPNGQIIGADLNSGHLYTVSTSGATALYGSSAAPSGFYGLAYSRPTGNFFADNLDPMNVSLYSIAGDGNSNSLFGELAGPNSGFFPTGNLAFGPGGKLYFDFLPTGGADSVLYTVDTSSGALAPVGSGLGTDILNLFSNGSTLYGIDANATSGIGIYRINTTTGAATQVSTVTGLPRGGYYLDTATASAPDTGSTLALLFVGLTALLGASRFRQGISLAR